MDHHLLVDQRVPLVVLVHQVGFTTYTVFRGSWVVTWYGGVGDGDHRISSAPWQSKYRENERKMLNDDSTVMLVYVCWLSFTSRTASNCFFPLAMLSLVMNQLSCSLGASPCEFADTERLEPWGFFQWMRALSIFSLNWTSSGKKHDAY